MMHYADNHRIADRLVEAADLLEQQHANAFRVAAYRKAAATIRSSDQSLSTLLEEGGVTGLTDLPGIGDSLARAIAEMVRTGKWMQLERLRGRFELFCNETSFQEMEPHVVQHYASYVERHVTDYVLLKNSRHGKMVATREGEVGVEQPILRDDYVAWFPQFDLRALDAEVYGQVVRGTGFASEVMVMERRR